MNRKIHLTLPPPPKKKKYDLIKVRRYPDQRRSKSLGATGELHSQPELKKEGCVSKADKLFCVTPPPSSWEATTLLSFGCPLGGGHYCRQSIYFCGRSEKKPLQTLELDPCQFTMCRQMSYIFHNNMYVEVFLNGTTQNMDYCTINTVVATSINRVLPAYNRSATS